MSGFESRDIVRISQGSHNRDRDNVVEERSLSISVSTPDYGSNNLGVTMRTSGNDDLLAIGMLYSEGIIKSIRDVESINSEVDSIHFSLRDSSSFNPEIHCRGSTVTSACGICGRSTIDDVLHMHVPDLQEGFGVSIELLSKCLVTMKSNQPFFANTGGSHACASFSEDGQIGMIFEDVGRHNAMDKLVGFYVNNDSIPLSDMILVVSGRASFELVQKSIRAGFPVMASIGAPSTMAIDLAREYGKTLICFAKSDSATVYSGHRRFSNF